MTDDQKDALDELKKLAGQKIKIGNAVFGIVVLEDGAVIGIGNRNKDPEPIDDDGVPFKSFSDELRTNGWTATLEPDATMTQGRCK